MSTTKYNELWKFQVSSSLAAFRCIAAYLLLPSATKPTQQPRPSYIIENRQDPKKVQLCACCNTRVGVEKKKIV